MEGHASLLDSHCCDSHWHNFWNKNTFLWRKLSEFKWKLSNFLFLVPLCSHGNWKGPGWLFLHGALHALLVSWEQPGQFSLGWQVSLHWRIHSAHNGEDNQDSLQCTVLPAGYVLLGPVFSIQSGKHSKIKQTTKKLLAVYESEYHNLIYHAGGFYVTADRIMISLIHFIFFSRFLYFHLSFLLNFIICYYLNLGCGKSACSVLGLAKYCTKLWRY